MIVMNIGMSIAPVNTLLTLKGYDKALKPLFEKNKGERYCMVHVGSEGLVNASLETAMRTSGAAAKYTCNGTIAFATDGVSMTVEQN